MEYKMESAQSGNFLSASDYNENVAGHDSMSQPIQHKETLIDYDKISSTNFDIENEVEKRILSHIGNYVEEPFNII